MEKFNKDLNSVDKFLEDNPQNKRIDSLILKFRDEVAKKSNDDFVSTRKLTIQPVDNNSSQRIDEQINDLENLIRRIQNEIVQLSENNLRPVEEDTEPIPNIIKTQDEGQDEIHHEGHVVNKIAVEDVDGDIAPVPPIILRDVELKFRDNEDLDNDVPNVVGLTIPETEDLHNQLPNLVGLQLRETEDLDNQVLNLGLSMRENDTDNQISTLVHKDSMSKAPENVTDIRETFSVLWNDEPGPVAPRGHGKSVEQLICELKAEINEKLESLHDVDIGQPLNNSDEEGC